MTNTTLPDQPDTLRKAGALQGILLLAGSCMPVLGSVLITPVLPQLSEHFADVPGAEILVPMIVAIPALIIAIFAPFAGQIVDRLGRKTLLIIAMFAYAVVGTAPAWLEGLPEILISRVLVGVCEAAIMTVCTTLIVDYFHEPRRRNKYLGLQTVTTTLAATVFIILGGALGVGGWHTPFWVYAVSIVIAVPMIFALWEPTPIEAGDTREEAGREDPHPVAADRRPADRHGIRRVHVLRDHHRGELPRRRHRRRRHRHRYHRSRRGDRVARDRHRRAPLRPAREGSGRTSPARRVRACRRSGCWSSGWSPGSPASSSALSSPRSGRACCCHRLSPGSVAATLFEDRGRVTGLWTAAFFFGQFLTPILMGAIGAGVGGLSVAVGVVGIAAAVVALLVGLALRRAAKVSVAG